MYFLSQVQLRRGVTERPGGHQASSLGQPTSIRSKTQKIQTSSCSSICAYTARPSFTHQPRSPLAVDAQTAQRLFQEEKGEQGGDGTQAWLSSDPDQFGTLQKTSWD